VRLRRPAGARGVRPQGVKPRPGRRRPRGRLLPAPLRASVPELRGGTVREDRAARLVVRRGSLLSRIPFHGEGGPAEAVRRPRAAPAGEALAALKARPGGQGQAAQRRARLTAYYALTPESPGPSLHGPSPASAS